MVKNIVTYLCLAILLSGCNGCSKKTNYAVHSDLKSAFNFKPGTYWIYQDSLGGSIDSFVVTANEFIPSHTYGSFTEDEYLIPIADYKLGPIYGDDSTAWQMSLTVNTLDLILNSFIGGNQARVSYAPFLTFPFTVGAISSISDAQGIDSGKVTQVFPTYTLNGQTYNNVAEVYHKQTNFTGKLANNWFYINSDIGIIKMRVNYQVDSLYRVWELQRCNIVK